MFEDTLRDIFAKMTIEKQMSLVLSDTFLKVRYDPFDGEIRSEIKDISNDNLGDLYESFVETKQTSCGVLVFLAVKRESGLIDAHYVFEYVNKDDITQLMP